MATIHLVHGYLGSGKTTFARDLQRETGGLRLSIDEWTVTLSDDPVHLDRELFQKVWLLMAGLWPRIAQSGTEDIILDFGFWTREQRDDARRRAADIGAEVRLYHVQCPDDIARLRCFDRAERESQGYYIDLAAFDALLAEFEPLDDDEPAIDVDTS